MSGTHSHEHAHSHEHGHEHSHDQGHCCHERNGTSNTEFAVFFLAVMIGVVVLFAGAVDYAYTPTTTVDYGRFQDIHVMTFIGVGFLLSFVARNGLTAVGHSFLVAAFVIVWYILAQGFFGQAFPDAGGRVNWSVIKISTETFIRADYCATAIIISFGAVFGRASASQLLIIALVETLFYAFNESIFKNNLKVVDLGGSMYIHVFGSSFGLLLALLMNRGRHAKVDEAKTAPESEITAMIGTLFLWVFMPSFNSAFAGSALSAERAVVNTILSLASSTVVVFLLHTVVYNDKVNIVEFQRAALSGGIAIAASAAMNPGPFAALIIGASAGLAGVLSFRELAPRVYKFAGFSDTNGILSLNFVPGVIGGIISIIVARVAEASSYQGDFANVFPEIADGDRGDRVQAKYQLAGLALCLGFGVIGGLFTGILLQVLPGLSLYHTDAIEYSNPSEEKAEAKDQKA